MPPFLQALLIEYGSNPFKAFWFLFSHGGSLVIIPFMVHYAWRGWILYIEELVKHHRKYKMYRIEVPQNNEQSMKAVEQIFVHIYGTKDHPHNRVHKYWHGFWQEEFSFELVSDGGYISFHVRTPAYYGELVQAAFYAQYPDAVLTEIEDYTKEITPEMIMSEKIRCWGSEMELEQTDVRPIKCWPAWEHNLVGRAVDPLASILEFMSRLQPGERLWYQLICQPDDLPELKERAKELIDSVVEPGGVHHGASILDRIIDFPIKLLEYLGMAVFGGEATPVIHETGLTERQRLTTPERELVEEVDRKASRWPFRCKLRFMYFASPKLYDEKKGRRGMVGGLKLYRFINAFEEGHRTRTEVATLWLRWIAPHIRILWRARRMLWAYKSRDTERGEHHGFILSTEEIASVFHFPQIEVRAPFVAKTASRGVEPPTQLRYGAVEEALVGASVSIERDDVAANELPRANIVPEEANSHPGAIPPGTRFSTPIVRVEPTSTAVTPVNTAPASAKAEPSGPTPPPNLPIV
ncbi:MAG: hypothetical protein HYV33_03870 [Candidatus Kerfeldbacteria bacterium]|nr:hypothetical protein [Candidatus Kerfeldbacteria bacterium]